MTLEALLLAMGLMLMLEGFLPMAFPGLWKRLFEQLLQLEEGQIRFFGMFMVLAGLLLFWLVS
jgi:uncharacterized protein YjeT (DUF2065 family)